MATGARGWELPLPYPYPCGASFSTPSNDALNIIDQVYSYRLEQSGVSLNVYFFVLSHHWTKTSKTNNTCNMFHNNVLPNIRER